MSEKKMSNFAWLLLAGCFVHIAYQFMFIQDFAKGGPFYLVYYNLISIIIFGVGSYINFKEENPIAIFLCFAEVSVFVFLAVFAYGWAYWFQNWLFSIIVMCIIVPFDRKRIFYWLAIFDITLYMYLYCSVFMKQDSFADIETLVYLVINVVSPFVMIILAERALNVSNRLREYMYIKQYKDMHKMASTDELTGLANRHCMKDILDDMNELIGKEIFYICFADIDDFKKINDSYGHDAGDEVLKFVSNILKQNIGKENEVARWGGEEFLFLIKNPSEDKAVFELLEEIRTILENSEIKYINDNIKLTMTFGVVSSKDFKNVYDMRIKADEMMYIGKTTGKNKVTMNL